MERQREYWRMWGAMIALALMTVAMLLLGGCTKAVYLPAENTAVRADTLAVLRWRTDTVIDRDTVTLTQRGDTVCLTKTQWRWRVKETHDTLYQSRTDSVYIEKPCPVEVVREVERRRGWWETALLLCGGLGVVSALGASAIWIKRRSRRLK